MIEKKNCAQVITYMLLLVQITYIKTNRLFELVQNLLSEQLIKLKALTLKSHACQSIKMLQC